MPGKMKFEDAIKKLEKIVEKLEKGDLSLDESMKLYEEGVNLSMVCQKQLDEMERKIEILSKNKDGNLLAEEFDIDGEENGTNRLSGDKKEKD